MLKLVSFLNTFDQSVRQKLSKLDQKLSKLERCVDYIEAVKASEVEAQGNSNVALSDTDNT